MHERIIGRLVTTAATSKLVTKSGKPLKEDKLNDFLAKIPAKYMPVINSWLNIKPFTLVKSISGGADALYTSEGSKRSILITPKTFTLKYGWATLVHECLHAVLFKENATHQLLKTGDLLLTMFNQSPLDPKFSEWKAYYTSKTPDYKSTIENGRLFCELLGMTALAKSRNEYDLYMFGNHIETLPAAVEYIASGLYKTVNKTSKGKTKKFFKWCNSRYKLVANLSI